MRVITTCLIAGATLGAASGAIARSPAAARHPISAVTPPISEANDGHEPLVTVGLEPSAVLRGAGGDALELQLELKSRSARPAAVRYSYELVDDRGNALQPPVLSSVASVAARGIQAARIATPAGLADGYFQVRVTAAAADGIEDTVQSAERYFMVSHGTVTPISSDEWFQKSNANQGRKL